MALGNILALKSNWLGSEGKWWYAPIIERAKYHISCSESSDDFWIKSSVNKNSLSDNIPVILAWSNDKSYESIFVEQLKNFLKEGDIVIAISGSGNSQNVINAINYANEINAQSISLTGGDGGKLSEISKINLLIPSNDMLTIETTHLCVCHLLTTMIRSKGQPIFSY